MTWQREGLDEAVDRVAAAMTTPSARPVIFAPPAPRAAAWWRLPVLAASTAAVVLAVGLMTQFTEKTAREPLASARLGVPAGWRPVESAMAVPADVRGAALMARARARGAEVPRENDVRSVGVAGAGGAGGAAGTAGASGTVGVEDSVDTADAADAEDAADAGALAWDLKALDEPAPLYVAAIAEPDALAVERPLDRPLRVDAIDIEEIAIDRKESRR